MATRTLKTVVFLGSCRSSPPFFGMLPSRTGDRVLQYVKRMTNEHNSSSSVKLEIEVVDPVNFPSCMALDTNNGNPTYYTAKDATKTGQDDLAKLVTLVKAADCFLIVTPEYNHTIPPALTAVMNQVGCSLYANKVSGCVCYSGFSTVGGGARCAVALRPYLSELGCLPVSKQVIIADANKCISENGEWVGEHKDGAAKTIKSMLDQLSWWGDAAASKRMNNVGK
eukprot:GSMAST32.ASY1.ANO1.1744.1 assembled CDS